MKKHISYLCYPVLALVGGALCACVRLMQNRTGFEADTGLPISGNLYAALLPVLLLVLAVAAIFTARFFPEKRQRDGQGFGDCFFSVSPLGATVVVCGIFLCFAGGVYDIYAALTLTHSSADVLVGGFAILSAGCLLPAAAAARRRPDEQGGLSPAASFSGTLLLAPVVFWILLLVIVYRTHSVNPTLEAYYPQLLALVFLVLAFFKTSSFAFQDGRSRQFLVCSMLAVILCLTALADAPSLGLTLLLAGGAVTQLGFLFLRGEARNWREMHAPAEEP
jgi:hypothetical protein